jgi:hypothetical protein
VDSNWRFLLGDFGSVVEIDGRISGTTMTFFPRDYKVGQFATELHDFWMLAMTVHDMTISESNIGEVIQEWDMNFVLEKLSDFKMEEINKLVSIITMLANKK